MKKTVLFSLIFTCFVFVFSACSSSKNTKKCSGKKGILTPMGVM